MARPVYSESFVLQPLAAGSPNVGGIPLAGETLVIRDITLWEQTDLPGDALALFIEPAGMQIMDWAQGTDRDYHWEGRLVVPYGFSFEFHAYTGTWNIACSGYRLTAG